MTHSFRWRLAVAVAAAGLVVVPLQRTSAAALSDQSSIHFMGTHDTYLRARQNASPNVASNLVYHGGPVMRAGSTTYSIFWQPTGTFMSTTYKSLINRYFSDVGGSALYGNDTQYYGRAGAIVNASSLGGTWTDTSAYPAAVLSDRAIQAEIQKAMQANGWTGGYNNMFFVFLAKGQQTCAQGSCSFSSFCAYHGSFSASGTPVIYANMPYAGTNLSACGVQSSTGSAGPNSDGDADSEINIVSHEHMEAVTDPLVNTLFYAAWYDASGQEIGDKCAWNFATVDPDGGNVTLNSHRYVVQQEWSNSLHGCTLG